VTDYKAVYFIIILIYVFLSIWVGVFSVFKRRGGEKK